VQAAEVSLAALQFIRSSGKQNELMFPIKCAKEKAMTDKDEEKVAVEEEEKRAKKDKKKKEKGKEDKREKKKGKKKDKKKDKKKK
jgi:hypothetical protein